MELTERAAVVALIAHRGVLAHPVGTNPGDAQAPCLSDALDFARWASWI